MPTTEVSDETLEKNKEQFTDIQPVDVEGFNSLIGGKWFFRTVTYHIVGKVKKVDFPIIELKDASWIASSGRFSDFLKTGEADEVEPTGSHFINAQTIVDFFPFKHKLPTSQK